MDPGNIQTLGTSAVTPARLLPSPDLGMRKNRREAGLLDRGWQSRPRDDGRGQGLGRLTTQTGPLVREVKMARNLGKTHRTEKVGQRGMLRGVKEA